ncbi:hypothetical protein HDU96_008594 [Phlyctochytrium bullatum]|nr:hypothetical protein HDU96_008594 [Phlyctochytrium bullatum]
MSLSTATVVALPTSSFISPVSTAPGIASQPPPPALGTIRDAFPAGQYFNGVATYYGVSIDGGPADPPPTCQPACGACGPSHVPLDPTYYAALSLASFTPYTPSGNPNLNPLCGQCALIRHGPNTTLVPLVDACPGCPPLGLDLSFAAFVELAGSREAAIEAGRIEVSWTMVSCAEAAGGPDARCRRAGSLEDARALGCPLATGALAKASVSVDVTPSSAGVVSVLGNLESGARRRMGAGMGVGVVAVVVAWIWM